MCNNVDVPTLPLSSPLFAQNCIAIDQASNISPAAVISSSSNFVTTKRPPNTVVTAELTSVVIHENHKQTILQDDDDDVITTTTVQCKKRTPLRLGGRSISRDFRPRSTAASVRNNTLANVTLNRAFSEDNIQHKEEKKGTRRRHSIHSAHSGKFFELEFYHFHYGFFQGS